MPLYKEEKNNVKPQSLMSFLMQKQEEWSEIEKLNLNKLSQEVFGKIMHDDSVKESAKICIAEMLKKSNMEYNDLLTDHEFDGLDEEAQQVIIKAWEKKFSPNRLVDDEEYKEDKDESK